MIDLHSHLIYGVDDGCDGIEDSIKLITNAKENGYRGLVLTPHYVEDSIYNSNVSNNIRILLLLKSKLDELGIDINLYLGNEVYTTDNILGLIQTGKITTINNSKYLLIELSMSQKNDNIINVIDKLVSNDITPIIAHPERYHYLANDYSKMEELILHGALFQLNMGSLIGQYGAGIQKSAKNLLKRNLIHFIGSDNHNYKHNVYNYLDSAKKIINSINPDLIDLLFNVNPRKVLNNEIIEPNKIIIKKSIFLRN